MDELQSITERLEECLESTNAVASKARLQLDAFAEIQSEERVKTQTMHKEEKDEMRNHYEKIITKLTRVIIGLLIVLVIILGSIIGGTIYVLANFDFAVATYQTQDITDGGSANIYDGINISTN